MPRPLDAIKSLSRQRDEFRNELETLCKGRRELHKEVARLKRELAKAEKRAGRQAERSESFKAAIRTLQYEGVGLWRRLRYFREQSQTVRSQRKELDSLEL